MTSSAAKRGLTAEGLTAKANAEALALAIADKIARILSGDPNYADNWRDIQGYASW